MERNHYSKPGLQPLTEQRIMHEGALSIEDIRPGLRFIVHFDPRIVNLPEVYVVDTIQRDDDGRLLVEVHKDQYPDMQSKFSLADMGVVPYYNGYWNPTNYITEAQ